MVKLIYSRHTWFTICLECLLTACWNSTDAGFRSGYHDTGPAGILICHRPSRYPPADTFMVFTESTAGPLAYLFTASKFSGRFFIWIHSCLSTFHGNYMKNYMVNNGFCRWSVISLLVPEAEDNSGKTGWMIINYQPVCPQIERLADW